MKNNTRQILHTKFYACMVKKQAIYKGVDKVRNQLFISEIVYLNFVPETEIVVLLASS